MRFIIEVNVDNSECEFHTDSLSFNIDPFAQHMTQSYCEMVVKNLKKLGVNCSVKEVK